MFQKTLAFQRGNTAEPTGVMTAWMSTLIISKLEPYILDACLRENSKYKKSTVDDPKINANAQTPEGADSKNPWTCVLSKKMRKRPRQQKDLEMKDILENLAFRNTGTLFRPVSDHLEQYIRKNPGNCNLDWIRRSQGLEIK